MLPADSAAEIQPLDSMKGVSSLKKLRWAVLVTGVIGSVVLVAVESGIIPSFGNENGTIGAVVLSVGAAFLVGCGVGGWWFWTKLADTRTKRVLLSPEGLSIEFSGGTTAELRWDDPNLGFTIKTFSNAGLTVGATLLWGSGGIGRYAFITLEGAERVRSVASRNGLLINATTAGKPPITCSVVRISRGP